MSDLPDTKRCACGSTMHLGFIPDHGDVAAVFTAVFVQGRPSARTSWWEKVQRGAGLQGWPDDDAWMLSAYRCEDCAKIDLFAVDRPDPQLTVTGRA